MIDITVVGEQLHGLGSALRRKISADMVTIYHTILDRRLSEEKFISACQSILEHETMFPAPSQILRYGTSWSRHQEELGEPYVEGMRLSQYLDQIQGAGPLPPAEGQFRNAVERICYEDAVVTSGGEPPEPFSEDRLFDWMLEVAGKAEAELAKIAEIEAARHGG